MSNPWAKFGGLTSLGAKTVVTVQTVHSDGTSTVQLRSGETLRAKGDGVAATEKAIIQAGEIKGKAPALPAVSIEV